MTKEPSLAKYLEQFDAKEQGVMMFCLNMYNLQGGPEIHRGLLPFVKVRDILVALTTAGQSSVMKWRKAKEVKHKLEQLFAINDNAVTFMRYLDPKLVLKRFGSDPSRGKAIPMVPLKKVTCGVRFNLGLIDKNGDQGDYEPDTDVMVRPHVVLKHKASDLWMVTCEKRYRVAVEAYLTDYCM